MTKPKRAPRRPPSAKPKSKGGRPPTYRDLFARQAERLVKSGATDADLAAFFEVSTVTIWRWKDAHPEFCKALTRGKDVADEAVLQSLFRRATGYSHDAVKIMTVSEGHLIGARIEKVPYVEHYPPDTVAAIFWLKNRRPDLWREKPAGQEELVADEAAAKIREAIQAMADRETSGA